MSALPDKRFEPAPDAIEPVIPGLKTDPRVLMNVWLTPRSYARDKGAL